MCFFLPFLHLLDFHVFGVHRLHRLHRLRLPACQPRRRAEYDSRTKPCASSGGWATTKEPQSELSQSCFLCFGLQEIQEGASAASDSYSCSVTVVLMFC